MLSVSEFHEKCFDRMHFILSEVKASNTCSFLRSFSETSPTHEVIKVMLMSRVSHFSKCVFIFRVLLYHRFYKPNIKKKYPETNMTMNCFTKFFMGPCICYLCNRNSLKSEFKWLK